MGVGGLHIAMQAVMCLYSVGRTAGVVMDIGDGVAHTVPVSEGFIIPSNIKRINLAGRDLTQYLSVLLSKRGYNFTTLAEMETVRDIKEQCCYVALDYDQELKKNEEQVQKIYELPDKKQIMVQHERFKCTEPLFKPGLLEMEGDGIHHILKDTVMNCDIDVRRELFENVVLSGGTCCIPGLVDRMKKELDEIVTTMRVRMVENVDRRYAVWKGSAVLADLRNFDGWVDVDDFLEYGPSCVHPKNIHDKED